MKQKIFISIAIVSLILSVGCTRKSKESTNVPISENTSNATNYQEHFNEDDRTWSITFDSLDGAIEKEFPINKGDILMIEGKMESGSAYIHMTQEGLDKDNKDILAVPMHGGDTKHSVERWDMDKKLMIKLSPKDAKKGEITIKLISQ